MGKKWVKDRKPDVYTSHEKRIQTLDDWNPKSDTINVSIHQWASGASRLCVFAHVDGIGLMKDFEPKHLCKAVDIFNSINEYSTIDEMIKLGLRWD